MTNLFIVHEKECDRRVRAEAWAWEDFAARSLGGYLQTAIWDDDRNWPLVRSALFGSSWLARTVVAPFVRARKRTALRTRAAGVFGIDDFRRMLDHLEARAPFEGFWVTSRVTVADLAIFAQLDPLRSPLTASQAREIKLRPALTDWLDRVGLANGCLTGTSGREKSASCPRIPIRVLP